MSLVVGILQFLLFLVLLALIGRAIVSWVMVMSPQWHPKGPALVLVEGVMTVTDPIVKPVERIVPPLRIGDVAINLSFMIVFLAILMLYNILGFWA